MERLILETISRHIKNKKVTWSSEHGFTMGKSHLTDLITFYDEMTGLIGEGRAVDHVYLDFSKASNTISPNILTGELMEVWAGSADKEVH